MSILFRCRADLLANVRTDLGRPHSFAAERVGFLTCKAGSLPEGGVVLLAAGYHPVPDDEYVDDERYGALIGPAAIRRGMQLAYNGGAEDVAIFHIHLHHHRGTPRFSATDLQENPKFIPDFFNVAPHLPHGAIVLSLDSACGYCWRTRESEVAQINRFAVIGAPLQTWEAQQ